MPSRAPAAHVARKHALCCRALVLALVLPLAIAWLSSGLAADEAFVCEGGRIVQVRTGQLERMKRTDPCVAAYYGIRLETARPPQPAAVRAEAGSAPSEAPLPVRHPRAAAPPAAAAVLTPALPAQRAMNAAAGPSAADIVVSPRVERVVFQHQAPAPAFAAAGAPASPTVDFRRVPVINAAPGTDAVYHHTR